MKSHLPWGDFSLPPTAPLSPQATFNVLSSIHVALRATDLDGSWIQSDKNNPQVTVPSPSSHSALDPSPSPLRVSLMGWFAT